MASAQTKVEIDGIWYNLITKGQVAEVTRSSNYHDGYSGLITIPTAVTYEGTNYTVTSIGSYAFYDCPSLTTNSIAIVNIGEYSIKVAIK